MRGPPAGVQGRDDGFSLLEMLVALSIVSMIGALMSGFLVQLKHLDRQANTLQQKQSIDSVSQYVGKTLRSAVRLPLRQTTDGRSVFLEGTATRLEFVAPIRISSEAYSLRRVTFELMSMQDGTALMQTTDIVAAGRSQTSSSRTESQPIGEQVTGLTFSYLAEDLSWQTEWNRPGDMPQAIRYVLKWESEGVAKRNEEHIVLPDAD